MKRVPRVAVLIESSRSFGRGMLEGVAEYVKAHGPWLLYYQPRGLDDPPPDWLRGWHGDGILARLENRRMARAVLQTGLPVVDVRGRMTDLGLPFVGTDNRAICQLGFEHLAERGLRNFGFVRTRAETHPHTNECRDSFRKLVEDAGHACHIYEPTVDRRRRLSWDQAQEHLSAWLQRIPKPVGLMTCIDDTGYKVLDACRRVGLPVPDEVALVSSNNDPILCGLATPPMSSIDIDARRVGYEATAILDRMMRRGRRNSVPPQVLVPPLGVVVRTSTEVIAVADREVANAVRFIRGQACHGINVKDVLRHVALSRSVLDQRFLKALGRTPKKEILRVRLTRARQLLKESNLPLKLVAAQCGFSSSKYMGDAFAREFGLPPGMYRRRHESPPVGGREKSV